MVDNEWLLDRNGNKLAVTGNTPQLKIEAGYWYVSTDGGVTWVEMGKATGDDGAPGKDGDSMFQSVNWDESFWYFALSNGEVIKIGRGVRGVKAVAAIPDWSDGSVKASDGPFTLHFDVFPRECAAALVEESDDIFEVKVVYTIPATKSGAGESLILPILSKSAEEGGVLDLEVDGSGLDAAFVAGKLGAGACLSIVWEDNVMTSGYFPLRYSSVASGGDFVPEAVDLGLSVKWASFNVGATAPEEYGDYYAWGETEPKSNYNWSTYKFGTSSSGPFSKYNTKSSYGTVDNKTVLDPEDDVAHVKLGGNWRMPTDAECSELRTKCTWTWTTNYNGTGVAGRIVTATNGNSIFLPAAGYWDGANLYDAGSRAFYWSSSLRTDNPYAAYDVYFDSDYVSRHSSNCYYGQPVRPVYGEFVPVASVSLDKTTLELNSGETYQLTASVSPSNATAPDVRWVSSDSSVATVDAEGLVAAEGAGSATITAYGSSGVSASCKVVVVKKPVPDGAVDLGLSVYWATCNIGANAPEEYGDCYAWGETEPYYKDGYAQSSSPEWKEGKSDGYAWSSYKWCNGTYNTLTKYNNSSSYGTVDNKNVLDPEDDAAHVNWGGSWRMPTDEEWTELRNNCTWTWTTQNGVKGRLVTSNTNGNSIFLPAAGYRNYTGLYYAGSSGYYWSSSLYTDYPILAWRVNFSSGGGVSRSYGSRFYGVSVRPVSE